MRNLALDPLWREAGNASADEAGFKADRIVFVNDVFFCARDVVSSHCIKLVAL